MSNKLFSENIKDVINLFKQAKSDYEFSSEQVNILDKMTQDYLHSMELDNLNYKERAKVATKLAECRRKRRTYKNLVEERQPLYNFLTEDRNKFILDTFSNILGETRKVEKYHNNRTYNKRVL